MKKHHILIVCLVIIAGFLLVSGGVFSRPGKGNAASNYSVAINSSSISNFVLSLSGVTSATPYVGQQSSQGVYVLTWGDGTPVSSTAVDSKSLNFSGGNMTGTWSSAHTYSGAGTYTATIAVCHQGCTGAEGAQTASVTITVNTNGSGSVSVASSGGGSGSGGIGITEDVAPVLTLLGDDHMNLTIGDTFIDPGATANDAEQGDLTSSIKIIGTVDTAKPGSYLITYKIEDEWLKSDEKTRLVVVTAKPEEPKREEVATVKDCKALLSQYIKFNAPNNSDQVKLLENFLNTHEGTTLVIDGVYKKADFDAVKAFQAKYIEILNDWGLKAPTGYVYTSTIKVINRLNCEHQ